MSFSGMSERAGGWEGSWCARTVRDLSFGGASSARKRGTDAML